MTKKNISAFDSETVKRASHLVLLDSNDGQNTYSTKNMSIGKIGKLNVVTKTANYTVTEDDEIVLVDASSGAITITLPTAATRDLPVIIKKMDVSVNAVTIDGHNAETIDGATTKVLSSQYNSARLAPASGNWIVV